MHSYPRMNTTHSFPCWIDIHTYCYNQFVFSHWRQWHVWIIHWFQISPFVSQCSSLFNRFFLPLLEVLINHLIHQLSRMLFMTSRFHWNIDVFIIEWSSIWSFLFAFFSSNWFIYYTQKNRMKVFINKTQYNDCFLQYPTNTYFTIDVLSSIASSIISSILLVSHSVS